MNEFSTRAITGLSYEYKESHCLVRLLTREAGRLAVSVPGARSARGGKGRAAWLEPLCEVEAHLRLREGAEVASLADLEGIEAREALRADVDRFALASFLLEIALEAAPVGEPAPALFDAVALALGDMERAAESPPLTLAAFWVLRVMTLLGVAPRIDDALLSGAWKRSAAPASEGKEAPRKPARFFLDVEKGLILAAPGEPGARPPRAAEDGSHPGRPGVERRVFVFTPAMVRAIYEAERAPTERLAALPALPPAGAAGLIAALRALAERHLEIRPRSARFLEQTTLSRFLST